MAFPFIIGADLAGTVEAVGPGATRFRVGDRVWGSNQGLFGRQGVTAEFAAVHEDWLYPTPSTVRRRGRRPGPGRDHGAPRASSRRASSRRARRSTSPAAPAASARWSSRWPRPPGPGSPPRPGARRRSNLPGPRRRPRPELQDRRHPRQAPRVRPRGDRRLVRDPARPEPRSLDPAAPPPGADDRDGRPGREARPARSARSTRETARSSASPCSTPRPTSSADAPTTS